MSQAALNTRNGDEEEVNSSRRNNGTRLAGILFLLTVLCTVFVSGWVVLGWIKKREKGSLDRGPFTKPQSLPYERAQGAVRGAAATAKEAL